MESKPELVYPLSDLNQSADDFWQVDRDVVLHPSPAYGHYKIVMSAFFNASHYVSFESHSGTMHWHSFHLRVSARADSLSDQHNVLVPYETLRKLVEKVVSQYEGKILNDLPPFRNMQPTIEILVGVISQQIVRMSLGLDLRITEITVMESPTQGITFQLTQAE